MSEAAEYRPPTERQVEQELSDAALREAHEEWAAEKNFGLERCDSRLDSLETYQWCAGQAERRGDVEMRDYWHGLYEEMRAKL